MAKNSKKQLIKASLKIMTKLRDTFTLSASLGVFDQTVPDGEVIEHVTGSSTHAMVLQKGLRLYLHAGAPGKAYMAMLPEKELNDVLDRLEMTPFTGKTITTREEMLRELKLTRHRGYAIDDSEYVTATACVGAAILDNRQYPIGAIWIHGVSQNIQEHGFDVLGREVALAAKKISGNLHGNLYQSQKEYADFVIQSVCHHIEANLASKIDMKAIAAKYCISYSTLGHWFKEHRGCGPNQYLLAVRLDAAMKLIQNTEMTVAAIAYETGFNDHIHFFKIFKKKHGQSPLSFRPE